MPAEWNEERWGKPRLSVSGDRVFNRYNATFQSVTVSLDLDTLPKSELVDRCAKLGLPTSGTKAELAERLRQ